MPTATRYHQPRQRKFVTIMPLTAQNDASSMVSKAAQRGAGGQTSSFQGVSWCRSKKRWQAQIKVCGMHYFFGRFRSEEAAARAVDDFVRKHKLEEIKGLNFPTHAEAVQGLLRRKGKKRHNTSSRFIGVSFHKPTAKWEAKISVSGRLRHLGRFNTEDEAAQNYDQHAVRLGRILNFPDQYHAVTSGTFVKEEEEEAHAPPFPPPPSSSPPPLLLPPAPAGHQWVVVPLSTAATCSSSVLPPPDMARADISSLPVVVPAGPTVVIDPPAYQMVSSDVGLTVPTEPHSQRNWHITVPGVDPEHLWSPASYPPSFELLELPALSAEGAGFI